MYGMLQKINYQCKKWNNRGNIRCFLKEEGWELGCVCCLFSFSILLLSCFMFLDARLWNPSRPSVRPSVIKFSQDWIISFSWYCTLYLLTTISSDWQIQIVEKKWWPEFGAKGPKSGSKWVSSPSYWVFSWSCIHW